MRFRRRPHLHFLFLTAPPPYIIFLDLLSARPPMDLRFPPLFFLSPQWETMPTLAVIPTRCVSFQAVNSTPMRHLFEAVPPPFTIRR